MRNRFLFMLAAAGLLAPAAFAARNDDDRGPGKHLGALVIAGDSLSAGYQDNQLIDCSTPGGPYCFAKPSGQTFGYANVIARQAGVNLNLPLIPPPGFPQIATVGGFDTAANFSIIPRQSNTQTLNVSVPGYTLGAMVGYNPICPANLGIPAPPYAIQVMALEILNPSVLLGPCSSTTPAEITEAAMVAQANPGTAILWIGSNDALFPLLFSDVSATDPAAFDGLYQIAIGAMAQSSKHLVVANIPDVTLLPYLTSVPKLLAIVNAPLPPATVQAALGLQNGDMVTPYAFGVIQANGLAPLPDIINVGGANVPVVIRASAIQDLRDKIAAYNATIASGAATYHATLVDIYSLVNDIAAHGVHARGQRLTTDFMGGLFSLDGVHPNNTGYAVIANEFIKTMNRELAMGIPPVSIEQVAKNDPMVFPSDEHGPGHVSHGMAEGLRGLMGRR